MIYTVTFNPSLDYVIGAEKLEPGKINRTTRENIYPGGKGNNVSVVLSNLGHKSKRTISSINKRRNKNDYSCSS